MKKARVSPMDQQALDEQQARENLGFEKEEEIIEKEGKEKTVLSKTRWRSLRNSIRVSKALKRTIANTADASSFEMVTKCLLEKPRKLHQGSIANRQHSNVLIEYFCELAQVEEDSKKVVDFEHVELLLAQGADINTTDKYGQCVLHEVARVWHTDVAKFLMLHGAVVNQPDDFGRTPLHVACAVNFYEMVLFLLRNGADIDAQTYGEHQKPVHYAAKNDAIDALKVLLDAGAQMTDRDYKSRTPLQIAAELDRSITARELIERGASAGVYDSSNLSAMTLLIEKMPRVALVALNQFHSCERAVRKEHFYLNYLVPPIEDRSCFAKSPLEVSIDYHQYQILTHPVMQKLINIKWEKFARLYALKEVFLNFLWCIIWTVLLCTMPTDPEKIYANSRKYWGPFLEAVAVASLLFGIGLELKDFAKSHVKTNKFREWRRKELTRDLKYCHNMWPGEREFLEREINKLDSHLSSYLKDKWNIFDWTTYALMGVVILCHTIHIAYKSQTTDQLMRAVGSAMMVALWVRLLSYARPFKGMGLFVIMVGHVVNDTLKILFLALHIFIPYLASFYVTYGVYAIKGYTMDYLELFYTLFQMTIVGDFNYENIDAHSRLMAQILCGTYIFFSGIVVLNLFIALMSNTFQRVYDNAISTAVMQCGASIMRTENKMAQGRQFKIREWISKNCAPQSMYYDDDVITEENTELIKKTHEIDKKVDNLTVKVGNIDTTDVVSQESVKKIEQDLIELKQSFQQGTMQTRVEIAGLGLMLRDLIEANRVQKSDTNSNVQMTAGSSKKKQRRKEKQHSREQSDTSYEEFYEIENNGQKQVNFQHIEPTEKETSSRSDEQIKSQQQTDIVENKQENLKGDNLKTKEPKDYMQKQKEFLEKFYDKTPAIDTKKPEENSPETEQSDSRQKEVSTSASTNEPDKKPTETFFEGYTFSERSSYTNIQSKWNSILSHVTNNTNDENALVTPRVPPPTHLTPLVHVISNVQEEEGSGEN